MFDLMMPASFQNIQKTCYITFNISVRMIDGVSNTSLGGKVNHAIKRISDWSGHPQPRFCYLTPGGRGTTTHVTEECRDAWTLVRWNDLLSDLMEALRSERDGPARLAAEQYAMTLQVLYGRRR